MEEFFTQLWDITVTLIGVLRPGFLTIHNDGKEEQVIVLGGLAEVSEKGLTVLAESAGA